MTECLVCTKGKLIVQHEVHKVEPTYMPVRFEFEMVFSLCDHCGADPVLAVQARENDKRLNDARYLAMLKYIEKQAAKITGASADLKALPYDATPGDLLVIVKNLDRPL